MSYSIYFNDSSKYEEIKRDIKANKIKQFKYIPPTKDADVGRPESKAFGIVDTNNDYMWIYKYSNGTMEMVGFSGNDIIHMSADIINRYNLVGTDDYGIDISSSEAKDMLKSYEINKKYDDERKKYGNQYHVLKSQSNKANKFLTTQSRMLNTNKRVRP